MASRKRPFATGSGWTRVGKRKVWGTGMRRIPTFRGRRAAPFRSGYDRTGGFYGRYSGRGGELKFFDTTRADTAMGSSGAIANLSLNLIPQGVTESERVGRKCRIRSLVMRGEMVQPTTTDVAAAGAKGRVIIYVDKQCNGATAAVLDILDTATVNSFRNLANSGRFQILMDKTYNMSVRASAGNGTANDTAEWLVPWSFFKSTCDIPIEFDNTTGAITEVKTNNIGVLTIANEGATLFGYIARVRFSDGS